MPSTSLIAAISAALIVSLASPAMAASSLGTKLVSCRAESCVLVSGHRDDPTSVVVVNGHPVAVTGKHAWQARLPVETVRQWSLPFARTIEVVVRDARTHRETAHLPIGLLGHTTELAALDVRIR